KIQGRIIDRSDFKNPDNDPRGPYVTDPLKGKATKAERPNLHSYSMKKPDSNLIWEPDPAKGWITDEEGYKKLLAEDRIWWPSNNVTGWPRKKRFLFEAQERMPASSFWKDFKSQSGARELDEILDERVFAFPKPIGLIQQIINYCVPKDGLILDSFAGTGTTAHAVLKQNSEDDGNRKFILVEMDKDIATKVTSERLRRVCIGYKNSKNEFVEGLGGDFQFFKLSPEPLFNASGHIRSDVSFSQLAEFIWFSETGTGYTGKADSPLLGVFEGRAIYLLYNGILKDLTEQGGNILTKKVLDVLPKFDGAKVIYAAANRLGLKAKRNNIVFKQTPYALEV
ncbi:site-specific DNA-methyltransferase, partial [Acinetobacter baumannii]|nr:site-specific DNA-methyltransferase [Acinetobacter baumannii]